MPITIFDPTPSHGIAGLNLKRLWWRQAGISKSASRAGSSPAQTGRSSPCGSRHAQGWIFRCRSTGVRLRPRLPRACGRRWKIDTRGFESSPPRTRSIHAGANSASASAGTPARRRGACVRHCCALRRVPRRLGQVAGALRVGGCCMRSLYAGGNARALRLARSRGACCLRKAWCAVWTRARSAAVRWVAIEPGSDRVYRLVHAHRLPSCNLARAVNPGARHPPFVAATARVGSPLGTGRVMAPHACQPPNRPNSSKGVSPHARPPHCRRCIDLCWHTLQRYTSPRTPELLYDKTFARPQCGQSTSQSMAWYLMTVSGYCGGP